MKEIYERLANLTPQRRALLGTLLANQSGCSEGGVQGESTLLGIARREHGDVVPMSHAQQRLWFIDKLDPGNPAYNCPVPVRLKGLLNREALRGSLDQLVARHEILRTTYELRDGEPVQVIHDAQRVPIQEQDISELDPMKREEALEDLVLLDADRPFDLGRGSIIRIELIRLAVDEHVLLVDLHHIANDHWSIGLLFNELAKGYNARVNGDDTRIPELPLQYADYSLWQRERLESAVGEEQLAFWKETLCGMQPVNLPTDRPRPTMLSHRGNLKFLRLDAALTSSLRELAQGEHATLFMVLLAGFDVLLARYTEQTDISVGCSVTERVRPELEQLIGFFVNTVVFRTSLDGDPSFRELLRRVRKTTLEGYAHSEFPFDLLVRELNVHRTADRNPLVPVMFILDDTPEEVAPFVGLDATWLEPTFRTTKFDLLVNARPQGDGVYGHVQYSTDLFDAESIDRLVGHYTTLLQEAAASPDAPISTLQMLSAEERKTILVRWNQTAVPRPVINCLHKEFEVKAGSRGEATAIVHRGLRYSYTELNAAAEQLAEKLRAKAFDAEALIAIRLDRSPELVIAILAILKAGGAYVPLDPSHHSGTRLTAMLKDLGVEMLLTSRRRREEAPSEHLRIICVDDQVQGSVSFRSAKVKSAAPFVTVRDNSLSRYLQQLVAPVRDIVISRLSYRTIRDTFQKIIGDNLNFKGISELLKQSVATKPAAKPKVTSSNVIADPEFLAYIICTSGSTGQPKAIALKHRGVLNNLWDLNERFGVGNNDAALFLSSPSFDMSVYETLGMLVAGATIVIPEEDAVKDPAQWLELLQSHQITIWNSAPALLELLVEELEHRNGPTLPQLRVALLGGDWIPVSLPDRLRKHAPNVRVIALGGATEASIHSTIYPVETTDPSWTSIPYGRPMANQRTYILDRWMQPTPIGVPGELHLAGEGLARGYINRPDLTSERFIECELGGRRERLFKTGDLARWKRDGIIELLGRIDFQIKVHGLRVDLAGVESVLRAHVGVKEAAVVATDNQRGGVTLTAYVVPTGDIDISGEQIRSDLAKMLPPYMVPSVFHSLDSLPKNNNGKVDRLALTVSLPSSRLDEKKPTRDLERRIVAIWREVLGIDEFGIDDDFFEIGGDSYSAICVSRLIDGVLPVVEMFRHRTVRSLASYLNDCGECKTELIYRLTSPSHKVLLNLVCVPYGGGNVSGYQALAKELPDHIALWSVALPGHDPGCSDKTFVSSEEVAEHCCDEILAKIDGPIAVYGQCAGASTAVQIAQRLENIGRDVRAIYAGAALPDPDPRSSIKRGSSSSADELQTFLTKLGGFEGALNENDRDAIINAVRHDLLEHSRFFERSYREKAKKLKATLHCVIGDRDMVTSEYEVRFRDWERFAHHVQLSVVRGGNHYFVKHEAAKLARLLGNNHPSLSETAD